MPSWVAETTALPQRPSPHRAEGGPPRYHRRGTACRRPPLISLSTTVVIAVIGNAPNCPSLAQGGRKRRPGQTASSGDSPLFAVVAIPRSADPASASGDRPAHKARPALPHGHTPSTVPASGAALALQRISDRTGTWRPPIGGRAVGGASVEGAHDLFERPGIMRCDPTQCLTVPSSANRRQTVLHRVAGTKSTTRRRGDERFAARHGLSAIESGERCSRRSPPRIR